MRYLGIDFGLKRIGFATSGGELAAPYKVIKVSGFEDSLQKVKEIVQNEGFDKIIIGLPEGNIGKIVLRFVTALKKSRLDVSTSDETLSSQKAVERMVELGIPKQKRRIADDTAAAIILQGYLDSL